MGERKKKKERERKLLNSDKRRERMASRKEGVEEEEVEGKQKALACVPSDVAFNVCPTRARSISFSNKHDRGQEGGGGGKKEIGIALDRSIDPSVRMVRDREAAIVNRIDICINVAVIAYGSRNLLLGIRHHALRSLSQSSLRTRSSLSPYT